MRKFRRGDVVKAISASFGWGGVNYGDIGVVVDGWSDSVFADFPNHPSWKANEWNLILVEEFNFYQKQVEQI